MLTRHRRLLPLLATLVVIACGTISVELDTAVDEEGVATHDLQMEVTGELAERLAQDFDPSMSEECTSEATAEGVTVTCMDLPNDAEAWEGLAGGDLDLSVTREDVGDAWEYRLEMANPFYGTDLLEGAGLLPEGFALDDIVDVTLTWRVTTPGQVGKTNADVIDGAAATFTLKLGDAREALHITARDPKPSGLFGACG